MARSPTVSIGMPVYNGALYLEEALESLLDQSLRDFELIISDNASTDSTQEICKRYAERDGRINYTRLPHNHGYVHNFNKVFSLAHGRYFKWAACDDVCWPDFLARCVEVLDRDSSVAMATSRVGGLDEQGRRVDLVAVPGPGQPPTRAKHLDMEAPVSPAAPDPTKRWRSMMENLWWTPHLYGLFRADLLSKTRLHPAHYMGDHILLAEVALHGRFYEVPEELLLLRVHAGKTSRAGGARSRFQLANPNKTVPGWLLPLRLMMVYPERVAAHAASVKRAPLTRRQRFICYYEIARAMTRWALAKASRFLARKSPRIRPRRD